MSPAVVSVSTFSKEYHSLSFTHAFPESIDDAGIYSKMHGARPLAHMSPLGPPTQSRRFEAQGHNYSCTKNTSHHNFKLDANSTHPAHSHLDCCSTALLCSICYLLSIICATQATTYAAHPVIPRPPSLKSQLRLTSIALSALRALQLCTEFSSSQQPNPRLPDSQSTLLLLENEALRVITSTSRNCA